MHRLARAEAVLDDLGLVARLQDAGRSIRIGSASFGLMATPDIDLGVLCPTLDTARIFRIAHDLFDHPRVKRVNIVDERGPFQSMPGPEDEGIYLGVRYLEPGGPDGGVWRLDVWFFPADAPRPELAMRDRLLAASDAERLAILRIKQAMLAAGCYGTDVHGIDIYRAVLDRGAMDIEQVVQQFRGRG
jgi:hypothetical protein